ncbi:MAG: hypothetical protein JSV68_15925 [Anaerolineaceae bacterium]|nr:MAG: hypothetical protein JSV68_15925 [Anaerolineaceae bacterium]
MTRDDIDNVSSLHHRHRIELNHGRLERRACTFSDVDRVESNGLAHGGLSGGTVVDWLFAHLPVDASQYL